LIVLITPMYRTCASAAWHHSCRSVAVLAPCGVVAALILVIPYLYRKLR
jgi:hypothetical protein